MDNPLPAVPKDVKILETAEDIQERREQVLSRYGEFKSGARSKRERLEDSRRFQVYRNPSSLKVYSSRSFPS